MVVDIPLDHDNAIERQLAQMTAAHVAAEEYLSKLTVDEASGEKVVRDTQM